MESASQDWLDMARFLPMDYARSTLSVCRKLLGSYLVHNSPEGITAGRIIEVEGYLGPHDKGSHSYGGKLTARTAAMFGEKGCAYVYLIYGMYWCFNVVSGPPGKPQAILIRALEPVSGVELMQERIGASDARSHNLCRGPGKLCRAMGIDGSLYGENLGGSRLFLVPGKLKRGECITRSPRINIAYAGSYADKPWRLFVRSHPCLSGPAKLNRQTI